MLDGGGVPQLDELRLHNGTVYRWNRPVYDISGGQPHLRVENRVLPAGPTVVDTMANAAFFAGLVRALADEDRPIWTQMSFQAASENFVVRDSARHQRRGLLAAGRPGAGRRAGRPQAVAAGRRRPAPVGGRRSRDRPAARHHRTPLPARGQRLRRGRLPRSPAVRRPGRPGRKPCTACSRATWSSCTATSRSTRGRSH